MEMSRLFIYQLHIAVGSGRLQSVSFFVVVRLVCFGSAAPSDYYIFTHEHVISQDRYG